MCRAFRRNLETRPAKNPVLPPTTNPSVIELPSTPAVFNTPPMTPPAAVPPMVAFPNTSRVPGTFSKSFGPV